MGRWYAGAPGGARGCAAKSSLLASWLEDDPCTNAQLTRSMGTACAPASWHNGRMIEDPAVLARAHHVWTEVTEELGMPPCVARPTEHTLTSLEKSPNVGKRPTVLSIHRRGHLPLERVFAFSPEVVHVGLEMQLKHIVLVNVLGF